MRRTGIDRCVHRLHGVAVIIACIASPLIAFGVGDQTEPALGGYCPVSYFTVHQAVKGDPAQSLVHAGQLYHFATADAKKQFTQDPAKYLPQFDGLCTTALGGSYGNRIAPDPTVFELRDGKLYLFSSQRAKLSYDKKPESYIEQATQRFSKPAVGGHCLVSTLKQGKPVLGDATCPVPYRGYLYHFADGEAQAEFLKNPLAYMPPFGTFCTVGVANGKKFPSDGSRLRVFNGKVYVLFDADAEKKFGTDPAAVVKAAEANWPAVKDQK